MNTYGRIRDERTLGELMMDGWKPVYRYRVDLVGYDPDVVEAILEYIYEHFDLVYLRDVETVIGRYEEVFITSHCKDFKERFKDARDYIKAFED